MAFPRGIIHMRRWGRRLFVVGAMLLVVGCVPTDRQWTLVMPEQRNLDIREPSQLCPAPIPDVPPPETVSNRFTTPDPINFTLDEAIRTSLANSAVIRVLAGLTVVTNGQTVYDPAISNTNIDEARAVFDPVINARNVFSRSEQPIGAFDLLTPSQVDILGNRIDNYELGLGISKKNITGGTLSLDVADNFAQTNPGPAPLSPQRTSGITLSYTQPLAQGGGTAANLAPIVIARINTERSYFQFKDGMQELVRGTIEAYWSVVFARTDVWARQQQVEQGEAAVIRADARQRQGFANAAELAQAKVALANFKATLIASEANLLQREAALRNIMGLPPGEPRRFVPVTPPTPARLEPQWDQLLRLAEERRPDLIELKLIIEADQQSLIVARNQAQPKIDATMLYRWNGLEGETPARERISTSAGQFTDWTVGVNFSVPLGLRASRAGLRQSELLLGKDRVLLDQGLHSAMHQLAGNVRNLAQYYEQYRAYRETRTAARVNLEQQVADFRAGRSIFLNVLQAITSWGDAVSSEAQALAQYNIELANLERQTGTILETHGVWMSEERSRFMGPMGRLGEGKCYPSAVIPSQNADRYPPGTEPAEKALERDMPAIKIEAPPGQ
jgi:outer membrane protein TolC